ncbi:MAG TPA: type IV pili twitching motility protein PilT, partial [Myxococcales bacterium]|nr:type IV pili twitching motility protein PilT [Myxococcales bacterium]
AAETGHLVLSTLHTLDATETIARTVSAFPPHQQKQVRLQLGSVLRGVISQRLVPRADGKGRIAAIEVLVVNARVREMIEDKDRTKEIPTAIAQSYTTYGMQTFDQSLMQLFRQNLITYEEALRQSSNPDDFALRVSGISATSDSNWDSFEQKDEAGAAPGKPGAKPGPGRPPPLPQRASPPGSPPLAKTASKPPGAPGAAQRPAAPAAAPAGGDDDFQIERF